MILRCNVQMEEQIPIELDIILVYWMLRIWTKVKSLQNFQSMLEYNYLKGCREVPEFYELAQE